MPRLRLLEGRLVLTRHGLKLGVEPLRGRGQVGRLGLQVVDLARDGAAVVWVCSPGAHQFLPSRARTRAARSAVVGAAGIPLACVRVDAAATDATGTFAPTRARTS